MNTPQEVGAALGLLPGGRVLDVATGTGGMIERLLDTLPGITAITGIDLIDPATRPGGLENSVFSRPGVRFVVMDAHHLEFDDASFDTVTIGNSLHHLTDPRRVLAEMARVLRPGGGVLISEMVRDGQTEEQLTHVHIHYWWARIDTALGIVHHETFTRAELVDLLDGMALTEWTRLDYADLDADPHDAETIAALHGHLDRYVERARDLPNFEAIQAQGDDLRRRLDTVGLRWATSLIAVGRK